MKKLITCMVAAIIYSFSMGQNYKFQATYGGNQYENGVGQECTNGFSYYGFTKSIGQGGYDALIMKTNTAGDLQWAKSYGSTGDDFIFYGFEESGGGHIGAGRTNSWGSGNTDMYLIKTDANGNHVWSYAYGYRYGDGAYWVEEVSSGGYVMSGIRGNSSNIFDGLVVKTNSTGGVVWNAQITNTNDDRLFSIKENSSGDFIALGSTNSVTIGNQFNYDLLLSKISSTGAVQWVKSIGTSAKEWGHEVVACDTGYVCVGYTENTTIGQGGKDVYVVRTDNNGNVVWAKMYGGSGDDIGFSIKQVGSSFLIAGSSTSYGNGAEDAFLMELNAYGAVNWVSFYGSSSNDRFNTVTNTSSSGYLCTGYTYGFGTTLGDFYTVKTDLNGNSGCHEVDTTWSTADSSATITWNYTASEYSISRDTCTPVLDSMLTDSILCRDTIYVSPRLMNDNGKTDVQELLFSAYPNPSTGKFALKFWGVVAEDVRVEVFTMSGRKLALSPKDNGTDCYIDLSNEVSGIFIIRVVTKDGRSQTEKVFLEK